MGVVAHSPPNYVAVHASYPNVLPDVNKPSPITHTVGSPPGLSFTNNINGLMQAVFSYGGATLFCEFMAEMRKPCVSPLPRFSSSTNTCPSATISGRA